MTQRNDGGPAYPIPCQFDVSCGPRFESGYGGMTLRDYFAAKAMQAFLSGHIAHYGHENHWPYDQMASEALDVADALLAARERS